MKKLHNNMNKPKKRISGFLCILLPFVENLLYVTHLTGLLSPQRHSSQITSSGKDMATGHIWPLTVRQACLISCGASLISVRVIWGIIKASKSGAAIHRVHAWELRT